MAAVLVFSRRRWQRRYQYRPASRPKQMYAVGSKYSISTASGQIEPGALANRDQIQVVYGNAYKEYIIVYALAYNQTRGIYV